jgi:hypothetical protein
MGWSSQSMIRHYGLNAVTSQKRKSVELAYKLIGNNIDEPSGDSPFNQIHIHAENPTKNLKKPIKNQQLILAMNQTGRNMASRPMDSFIG